MGAKKKTYTVRSVNPAPLPRRGNPGPWRRTRDGLQLRDAATQTQLTVMSVPEAHKDAWHVVLSYFGERGKRDRGIQGYVGREGKIVHDPARATIWTTRDEAQREAEKAMKIMKARHSNPARTKQGQHGTLYAYAIEYTDSYDPGFPPGMTWTTWAYNKEHALEKFADSDEGFIATKIAKMTDLPRHRWKWTRIMQSNPRVEEGEEKPYGVYFEPGYNSSYGTPQKIWIADDSQWEWARKQETPLFVFSFGAYGDTKVAVIGKEHLEEAMSEVEGWISEMAPGLATPPEYPENLDELDEEDRWEALDEAESDLTLFGDEVWIASWEWHVDEYRAGSDLWEEAVSAAEEESEEDGEEGWEDDY